MFQQKEMSYESQGTVYGYAGDGRFEEASPYSKSGQELIREASGQAPTAVQRLALALVSLGILMGMTILLTIVETATSAPGWVAFPFLFVLTLFTTAVVSINVVFKGKIAAWVQDALVPVTTRCMGNCHWNRDTQQAVLESDFQATQVRQLSGGLQPMLSLSAIRPWTQTAISPT